MKSCIDCKYAEWDRDKTGKLHISGEGKCKYPCKLPVLPNSRYWLTLPTPCGGFIHRLHKYKKPCPCYIKKS
jgi:hypothetical protein